MIILSIETSCDETAISIIEALGDFPHAKYEVLGNALFSQIEIHREYGGVFPSLAKREHALTVVPMLEKALREAHLPNHEHAALYPEQISRVHELLYREEGLADAIIDLYEAHDRPSIDCIAVTNGPGLEPALWVGVNFALALSYIWDVPVVPVNHMEGHILSSIFDGHELAALQFPAIALLISGGHTELVRMQSWQQYETIGSTRDDAIGEAFDKVARLLNLPYPGGPEISRLAEHARIEKLHTETPLPRPMIKSVDLDFSFSGIKTAVRYMVEGKTYTEDEKAAVAREFEDAVTEVLVAKTKKALMECGAQSLILGGGVSANKHIRHAFDALDTDPDFKDVTVYLPDTKLSTDNAIMVALAGHARVHEGLTPDTAAKNIRAEGNKSLES